MATRDYEGKKYDLGSVENTTDSLTVEEALQININGEAFTITMRTPGNDQSLIRGLLHAEGVISDVAFIPQSSSTTQNETALTIVDVVIPEDKIGSGYTNSRSLLSVSSCGICGKTQLDDLSCEESIEADALQLEPESLQNMFSKMDEFQKAFKKSGGSHAAAAFDIEGNLLCSFEDIGRHNAVDKVVGELIHKGILKDAFSITVSGRISYEIVVKCFKARVPILAAVSAPSSLAVDYAKELGITLFAFCRNTRATCYSNIHRIKNLKLSNQAG